MPRIDVSVKFSVDDLEVEKGVFSDILEMVYTGEIPKNAEICFFSRGDIENGDTIVTSVSGEQSSKLSPEKYKAKIEEKLITLASNFGLDLDDQIIVQYRGQDEEGLNKYFIQYALFFTDIDAVDGFLNALKKEMSEGE